jgi:acylphosphatase
VQGVGFRATTERMAQRFAIAGYVRNLQDGTVELVAHGSTAEVDRFLAAVAQRFASFIERTDDADPPQDFVADEFTTRV